MKFRTKAGIIVSLFFSLFFNHPIESEAQATRSVLPPVLQLEKIRELYHAGFWRNAAVLVGESMSDPSIAAQLDVNASEELKAVTLISGLQSGEMPSLSLAKDFVDHARTKKNQVIVAFYLGDHYFSAGDYPTALTYLELTDAVYLDNAQNEKVQFEKGVSYFSQRKFDNAKPFLRSIIQLANSEYAIDSKYYLGFILFSEKQYAEAFRLFSEIEKSEKYAKVVTFYLSYISHVRGQDVRAIEYGEKYIKGGDTKHLTDMQLLLASLYYNRGDVQKSVSLYESLKGAGVSLNPVQRFELGSSYYQLARYRNAMETLKPLSAGKDSTAMRSMYVLGLTYLQLNDKPNARSSFQYCDNGPLDPEQSYNAQFLLAKLSLELGYEDQAVQALDQLLKEYSNGLHTQEAREILLNYYARTNNYREALEMLLQRGFSNSLIQSVAPRIYYGRGMELINDLQYAEADKMMGEIAAYKSSPFYQTSLFWRGELASRSDDHAGVIRYLNEFFKTPVRPMGEANEVNGWYDLGYAYYYLSEYRQAMPYFEKIIASDRNVTNDLKREAILRTADCAFMQKNVAKARPLYQQIYDRPGYGSDYAAFQLALVEGIRSPGSKIEWLKISESKFPKSPYFPLVIMELADTYMSEEQFEKAIPYLKRIPILVDKENEMIPESILKLGIAYYNLDRTEEAIAEYNKLIADYPASEQANEALETAKGLFVEKGRISDYQRFLEKSGRSISDIQKDSLMFQFVQTTYAEGNRNSSLKALNDYATGFPDGLFISDVLNYKAELYLREKNLRDAVGAYMELAAKGASKYQEKALRQAARISFFDLKDYGLALENFSQLTSLASNEEIKLESERGEIRSLYYLKRWEEGEKPARQLLSMVGANPDDKAFAHVILGYKAQMSAQLEESNNHYRDVVGLNKSALGAESRYQLASNAFQSGNLDAAESLAQDAIENSGSYDYWITRSYIIMGRIFIQRQDVFNAKATLKSVVDHCDIEDLKNEAKTLLSGLDAK